MIPSHYKIISPEEKSILHALKNEQLTSLQILKKVDSISHILKVYSLLEKLTSKGLISSHVIRNMKYHHIL
jgi:sugar-specific transcriptional regulator TrmB